MIADLILKISFLFNYILPNSFIGNYGRNIYYFNKGIYNLILIIFTFFLLKNNQFNLKKREVFLIIFIFFRVIVIKDIQSIGLLPLILIDRIEFDKKINKKIIWVCIFFSFLYSIYFFKFHGRPISTSIGEKNISGFYLFVLYLLCQKFNFRVLTLVTLFMGIFIFSRNFLLAVIVQILINKLKFLQNIIEKIKLNKFLPIAVLTFILMYSLGIGFEKYVNYYGVNSYAKGFSRYVTLVDKSNLYRFQANNNVIKFYIYNPRKILLGITIPDFKNELKNNLIKYDIEKPMEPHNFFYKYLLKYGIFSFFLFYYIDKILKKISNKNLDIFYGFYIYSIFLGVGFYDFYLLILKYIMGEKNEV